MKEKTLQELEDEGFEGIDANLSISLFEYGFAYKKTDTEIVFIYGKDVNDDYDYVTFNTASIPKNTDPRKEWDWVNWSKIDKFAGMGEREFLSLPLEDIVMHLVWYYGTDSVFGEGTEVFTIKCKPTD